MRPKCPCPNANSTHAERGEAPMTGSESGVEGRVPIQRVQRSITNPGSMRRASVASASVRDQLAGASALLNSDVQHALVRDQLRGACVREQVTIGFERARVQRAQRSRRRGCASGSAGAAKVKQPRNERRQVPPRECEGAERVGDPLRNVRERAGQRERHDRARRDGARVAEGRSLPRRTPIDQRHAVAVALQVDGRRRSDDAGADDNDICRARQHRRIRRRTAERLRGCTGTRISITPSGPS
jgi:hypothetical protein